MAKTIGVLGGMGPEATVDFLARVIAATDADSDQGHIRMLVDHNPQVPNRHDAIAAGDPRLGEELAAMAAGLERAGADGLVMVCNTAHAAAADIEARVQIPFFNMIDLTVEALARHSVTRVGLMAARGCIEAGLYQTRLADRGYEVVLWEPDDAARFMALLYAIKAGQRGGDTEREMRGLALSLVEEGAEAIIAGCTEIPLVLDLGTLPVPCVASTDVLVRKTIEFAIGDT